MSMYIDLISDFPSRYKTLMDLYYEESKKEELSVSFLLMIASSAFIIPLEKLRFTKSHSYKSESGRLIKNSFLKELSGKVELGCLASSVDEILKTDLNSADEKPVSFFLSIIRNSLAHGNIHFIETCKSSNTIGKIVFISENLEDGEKCEKCSNQQRNFVEDKKYKFLIFEVDVFKKFLDLWFAFLNE